MEQINETPFDRVREDLLEIANVTDTALGDDHPASTLMALAHAAVCALDPVTAAVRQGNAFAAAGPANPAIEDIEIYDNALDEIGSILALAQRLSAVGDWIAMCRHQAARFESIRDPVTGDC